MHKPDIFEMNRIFQESRPIMDRANKSPHVTLQLLCGEIGELDEEFQLWDQGKSTVERVGDEISDVMLFCCTLFSALGLNGDQMVREKVGRNQLKYEAHYLQEGEFSDISQFLKRRWKSLDGDTQFNAV